jgi:hypothetical protein
MNPGTEPYISVMVNLLGVVCALTLAAIGPTTALMEVGDLSLSQGLYDAGLY